MFVVKSRKFWLGYNLRNIYQNPHLIKLLVWKRYQAAIELGVDRYVLMAYLLDI